MKIGILAWLLILMLFLVSCEIKPEEIQIEEEDIEPQSPELTGEDLYCNTKSIDLLYTCSNHTIEYMKEKGFEKKEKPMGLEKWVDCEFDCWIKEK